jgi:hypothetical protein
MTLRLATPEPDPAPAKARQGARGRAQPPPPPNVLPAAPDPLWPLTEPARGLWMRLATTAVLSSHHAMVRLMRYCQLLAAWQKAMQTVGDKGVAQAIKTGDGKGVREAKLMPHAEWVVRVEAILARLEDQIEWRVV